MKRFARRRSREAVEEVGPTGAPRNVGTKTFAFFIRERTAVRSPDRRTNDES